MAKVIFKIPTDLFSIHTQLSEKNVASLFIVVDLYCKAYNGDTDAKASLDQYLSDENLNLAFFPFRVELERQIADHEAKIARKIQRDKMRLILAERKKAQSDTQGRGASSSQRPASNATPAPDTVIPDNDPLWEIKKLVKRFDDHEQEYAYHVFDDDSVLQRLINNCTVSTNKGNNLDTFFETIHLDILHCAFCLKTKKACSRNDFFNYCSKLNPSNADITGRITPFKKWLENLVLAIKRDAFTA